MKRTKHGFFVFPPKKTLIWRRHCSIDQSCYSMTSKRFLESSSDMKFFQSQVCLYPFDKPIKSLYFRSLVVSVLFASFHFENRSSYEDDRDTQNVVTSEASDLSAENSGKFL